MRFAVSALASLLVSSILACGGAPTGAAPTAEVTAGQTQAVVAQKASDPRTNDPTGAPPAVPPESPARFSNIGMTGAAPPSPPPSTDPSGPSAPPAKISARHVLIQWMGAEHAKDSVVRTKEQALKVAQGVLKRARAKEDFTRLAVEYSDEPNAGARGGSVGRFGHGQMVPEFEAVAFKLQVGEISDVVESPFGYHVIQRTE